MLVRTVIATATVVCLTASGAFAIHDQNGNQQSDIWEAVFGAIALNPSVDSDKDGFTNLQESIAGTNPLDPNSTPKLLIEVSGAELSTAWSSILGKRYTITTNGDFDPADWQPAATLDGTGAGMALVLMALSVSLADAPITFSAHLKNKVA